VKSSLETAHYGGSVRLNYGATSGELVVHPDLYRLYSITVSVSNIIDIVLQGASGSQPRVGAQTHFVHRGIGGTGNLRMKYRPTGEFYDFVAGEWVESPTADCLADPGDFITATYVGTGAVPYVIQLKTATPSTIL
jgi:hypothetical protein